LLILRKRGEFLEKRRETALQAQRKETLLLVHL
jgi:hypothetical protein